MPKREREKMLLAIVNGTRNPVTRGLPVCLLIKFVHSFRSLRLDAFFGGVCALCSCSRPPPGDGSARWEQRLLPRHQRVHSPFSRSTSNELWWRINKGKKSATTTKRDAAEMVSFEWRTIFIEVLRSFCNHYVKQGRWTHSRSVLVASSFSITTW